MIENYTSVKTWSIEEVVSSLEENPSLKEKITIPKFQRSIVWKYEQRKLLVDSIKYGMPIGSILLYKMGEENGITKYQLIDGLQRVTTLKKYYDKPNNFYDQNNLPEELIEDLRDFLEENIRLEEEKDVIEKWIVNWIKNINGFKESDNFSSHELARFLDKKIKDKFSKDLSKEERDDLTDFLKPYIQKIREESDISDFKVPVIVYTGDRSRLPTIFERINSKGTQLNKYQIFAATWTIYGLIKIKNKEIIDNIKAKYEAIIKEGLEIDNYDEVNFNNSKFTYFEYLFGIGKLMVDEYPLLFSSRTSEHEADSIGFNVTAICLNHDLKNLATLPGSLKNIDIDDFEKKMFKAIEYANDILRPYIGLTANKKKKNNNDIKFPIFHSEFQIVSIIGKIYNSMEDIDDFEHSDKFKKLKKNIPLHYLYDIIKGYWSGTGDKKAMEDMKSEKYEKEIKKELWEMLLNEFHENEKAKKEKTRESINNNSILFLKYIYTHLLTANEELSTTEFEIDHVIPLAKLREIANKVGGLPISSIGNLALIKKDLNRKKRDKTFYEYIDLRNELTEIQKNDEIEKNEKYTFTTRDMLEFINDINENNIEKFYDYLDKRFKKMKEKFYELNNIL